MEHIHHFIGGKQTPSTSGRTGPVFNPATGLQTAQVDLASIEEVDAAVASAAAAFPGWRATSVAGRVKLMFKFRELVERNAAELAATISAEHGKTEADAVG